MQRSLPALPATLALAFLIALPAAAATITFDFESYAHGGVVAPDGGSGMLSPAPGFDYLLTASNPNRSFDIAAAFDTTPGVPTNDPDLEQGAGWSTGNLAPNTALGNILILQENNAGCQTGLCTSPDDEGRRPAGLLTFDPVVGAEDPALFQHFAFDLIDVDSATLENGSITFFNGLNQVTSFAFADFLGLGQGVTYGNNSANRILLNGIGDFDSFRIALGGSGGVDNLTLSNSPIVPEPASIALLALGLAGLGVARRSRR